MAANAAPPRTSLIRPAAALRPTPPRRAIACPRRAVSPVAAAASCVLADAPQGIKVEPVDAGAQSAAAARRDVSPDTVASIILGGGAGTRLFPLTRTRAKPAVPVGGCYRLIDIPMSNCINSKINKIYVLTQFNSQSLNRHIARTYNFGEGVGFGDGSVEVLAATQTAGESGKKWFQGTADAVRQFLWLFEDARLKRIENILILSGDHLYRMDYMDFVQKHVDSGADISVACVPMDESRASDFGLMKTDRTGRITDFFEKPKGENLKSMLPYLFSNHNLSYLKRKIFVSKLRYLSLQQVDMEIFGLSPEVAKTYKYMASMGIYVFKTDVLLRLLRGNYPTANDFGSEVIPLAAKDYNVQAYLFDGYWEDIGTIKSFYEANLALTDQSPNFYFYDPVKPIFTSPRFLPPTKVENCKVLNSIVSHGCFLTECNVEHSVIGIRSRLEPGVQLKDTMMMGADYYQTEAERFSELSDGKVPVGVGENTQIRNCIIDKNARIGKNVVIVNSENVQEADRPAEGFYIRSGITVVLKNAVIPNGTTI
ncbi:hypothetical protein EJB05_13309 [Eragrostis curvula]|uniref:Glucose-1-phosphate adenylyltransferase n=1 Tax=Eragrostis curvula TaxID=38414 RepID=A0A5J9VW50_9POAL|nr:hypothetical protein EJB05_13309 [Eragrostis curvula]